MLIYIYDLKIKDKRTRNAIKRRFYYALSKLSSITKRKTKSVLIVDERDESAIDSFFKEWRDNIEAYKICAKSIESL